eukprot:9601-Heterococcus_DN1.PRE.2
MNSIDDRRYYSSNQYAPVAIVSTQKCHRHWLLAAAVVLAAALSAAPPLALLTAPFEDAVGVRPGVTVLRPLLLVLPPKALQMRLCRRQPSTKKQPASSSSAPMLNAQKAMKGRLAKKAALLLASIKQRPTARAVTPK